MDRGKGGEERAAHGLETKCSSRFNKSSRRGVQPASNDALSGKQFSKQTFMSDGTKPTEAQKSWFARIFGPETWQELCRQPEFVGALDNSLGLARRIALRHLAAKELAHSWGHPQS